MNFDTPLKMVRGDMRLADEVLRSSSDGNNCYWLGIREVQMSRCLRRRVYTYGKNVKTNHAEHGNFLDPPCNKGWIAAIEVVREGQSLS